MNKKAALALLTAGFTYSTFPVFIRIMSSSFGTFTQISLRTFIATLILLALIFINKLNLKLDKAKLPLIILFCLSFPTMMILFTFSVLNTKASNSVFTLFIGAIITTFIVGKVFYKEEITKKKLFALSLVIIGLIFFSYPFNFEGSLGISLGLLAGIFEGITNSLRKNLGNLNRNTLLFYQYLTVTVLSFIIALVTKEQIVKDLNIDGILAVLAIGIGLIIIGSMTLYGFKNFDVNLGTIIISSELVFSIIISAIFLKEYPSEFELLGSMFIILSIVVINVSNNFLQNFNLLLKIK